MNRLFIKLSEGIYQEMDKAKDLTKLIKKHVVDKNGRVTTVWVKVDEDVNVRRSINVDKRLWFLNKDNNNVSDLVKFMRKQDYEFCCVTNDGKTSFFKKAGHKSGINFTDEELNKIRDSKQFIHNHPKGHSFSENDLITLIFNNIKEMNIVSQIKNVKINYKMTLLKPIPQDIREQILNSYNINKVASEVFENKNPSHMAMQIIAEEYDEYIKYEYEEI